MLTPMTRRNRYMAGNICLVVFLALLFSVAGGLGAPSAQAAPPLTSSDNPVQNNSYTVPSGYTSQTYYIAPCSESTFANTIQAVFRAVINKTNNRVSQLVYSKVYDSVYQLVYGAVYIVYSAAESIELSTVNIAYMVYDDENYTSGHKWVKVPIPKTGGGGGGGGAATTQPTTTTTTETATITQTGDTATIAPNVAAITSQLANGAINQVTFAVPSTVTAAALTVQMPAALVQALTSTPVPVQVQAPNATVILPAQLFSLPVIQQLAHNPNAQLSFEVNNVTAAAAPQVQNVIAAQPNANGYTAPVAVFEFALNVVQPGQVAQPVTSFGGGQAQVKVTYDQAALAKGQNEWKLNFYRVEGNSLTPNPTWIDSVNNQATMKLSHFSRYALIGYSKSFADVAGHWAQGTVELLASKHIISGIDGNNFAPNRNITRAEFAALLQKMLGLTAKGGQAAFKDVQAGSWYYNAVQAAYQAGIVKGRAAGVFEPQANITRQEMAAMIVRALNYLGVNTSLSQDQVSATLGQFADQASIAPWAREVAAVAATKGIISGRSGGNFAPTANATRAESATMLYNLIRSAGLLK
ncbi:MAG TPA: hypothetical protein GXX39_05560 [Syntrophothermus lipocalidus]|nr:hypothetical protein [Syntrophothermus lipocalidus]